MTTPTPRTDAAEIKVQYGDKEIGTGQVPYLFARQLERDLAAAQEARERAEALAESYKAEKEAAVAQERERCAKVCEGLTSGEFWNPSPDDCAAAIRRGE